MESSKRAVEAYKRTRMVDLVIVDDDKVAPVYRLDEIADMLRSSSSDMVREVVEYTMKRLGSKSPRVKQKVLRMLKFVVPKGGSEFKRQVQRQSAVIRQLFDYKGQPDPLRGDALNKAVRDMAHEAIAAIFSADDNKALQSDDVNKRIMGFGSTNYESHVSSMDPRKTSLTDVVSDVLEFGSSSIKQGLTILSGYTGANPGNTRSDVGTYRGPALRKSLTSERETFDRFDRTDRGDSRAYSEISAGNSASASFNSHVSHQESSTTRTEINRSSGDFSVEDRLLDTITAPGGMRLQPTRESMQKFLASAVKLNQTNFCHALESKLRSHAWQVRFKALCVLEAIQRQEDEEFFSSVIDYFKEDAIAIQECVQLPQTSVREKAQKVLDHLGASSDDGTSAQHHVDAKKSSQPVVTHDMPNLIDTGDSDLLGDDSWSAGSETTSTVADASVETDDVFAGLSFHTTDKTDESSGDLFSGLSVDNTTSSSADFDLLGDGSSFVKDKSVPHTTSSSLDDLLGNVSLEDSKTNGIASNNGNVIPHINRNTSSPGNGNVISPNNGNSISPDILASLSNPQNTVSPDILASLTNPQMAQMNSNVMFPMGMVGGYQAPLMMPQNFGAGLIGNAILQQQILSGMMGLQMLNTGVNGGNVQGTTSAFQGDVFDFSGDATSRFMTDTASAKKEDTKAFDFISDHISAARVTKKS